MATHWNSKPRRSWGSLDTKIRVFSSDPDLSVFWSRSLISALSVFSSSAHYLWCLLLICFQLSLCFLGNELNLCLAGGKQRAVVQGEGDPGVDTWGYRAGELSPGHGKLRLGARCPGFNASTAVSSFCDLGACAYFLHACFPHSSLKGDNITATSDEQVVTIKSVWCPSRPMSTPECILCKYSLFVGGRPGGRLLRILPFFSLSFLCSFHSLLFSFSFSFLSFFFFFNPEGYRILLVHSSFFHTERRKSLNRNNWEIKHTEVSNQGNCGWMSVYRCFERL